MSNTVLMSLGFGGLLLSAISGRITLMQVRGGIQRPLNAVNAVGDVIGTVAGLCFWALIIWLFGTISWYIALPGVLIVGFAGGLVVNHSTMGFFFSIERILDLLVVLLTMWLWYQFWPF